MEQTLKNLVHISGLGVSFCKKSLDTFKTYDDAEKFVRWASHLNYTEGPNFDGVLKLFLEEFQKIEEFKGKIVDKVVKNVENFPKHDDIWRGMSELPPRRIDDFDNISYPVIGFDPTGVPFIITYDFDIGSWSNPNIVCWTTIPEGADIYLERRKKK